MKSAFIVVDVQNDFCKGGALEVKNGDEVVPIINKIIDKYENKFYKIIATQDWHPQNHISFAKSHNKKLYSTIEINGIQQVLWPVHCVEGTKGADFHPDLDTKHFNLIIRKGNNVNIDSYSGFFENDKSTKTGLEGYLKTLGIKQVFIAGLAFDFCVAYTAFDAKKLGFETFIIEDGTKAVDLPEGYAEKIKKELISNGIKIIYSSKTIEFL